MKAEQVDGNVEQDHPSTVARAKVKTLNSRKLTRRHKDISRLRTEVLEFSCRAWELCLRVLLTDNTSKLANVQCRSSNEGTSELAGLHRERPLEPAYNNLLVAKKLTWSLPGAVRSISSIVLSFSHEIKSSTTQYIWLARWMISPMLKLPHSWSRCYSLEQIWASSDCSQYVQL